MDKITLKVVLNNQRKDKDGKYPVRIRSCIKRQITYYKTGISVKKHQFENGQIVIHPNRDLWNASIRKQLQEIESGYLQGNLNIKKVGVDFFEYATKKAEQQKKKVAVGTYIHKISHIEKLKGFKSKVLLSEITPAFLHSYENYCRGLGNKETTVWSSIKFIKTVVHAALNDRVISENPMKGYKMPTYVNPVREFLTDKEIDKIEKFAAESDSEKLVKVANWFLFSVYTGLRYDDIRTFDKKKIVDDRIILRTGKSKSDVSIKIHPKLKSVLDRITTDVYSNQKTNDYLKLVAEGAKIHKNLSMHLARHTFAVYFLNHGGSMEALSKLLGHTSIRVTQIYGKITNQRIDDEMDKVWK